jgi:NTE family protein
MTITMGQPGFFAPRYPGPWFTPAGAAGATSYYDTNTRKSTLQHLVDFDLINSQGMRVTFDGVDVRSGNFVYFDNAKEALNANHVTASGALPPALPAIKIDGEYYWDRGIVSNTPPQYLLEQEDNLKKLVFQVDLFSARGSLPRDMRDVLGRHKDIMFSSRTRQNTDHFRRIHTLRHRLAQALAKVPPDLLTPDEERLLQELSDMAAVNIVHLIYQQKSYEGHAGITNSPARPCASIGKLDTTTRGAPCGTRIGWHGDDGGRRRGTRSASRRRYLIDRQRTPI